MSVYFGPVYCPKCGLPYPVTANTGGSCTCLPDPLPVTSYSTGVWYRQPPLTAEQEAEVRRIVREEIKPLFEKMFEQAIFWGDGK